MNCENEFEMFKDFVRNTDEEFNDGKFEYTHEFSEVKNLHVEIWTNYLPDYDKDKARSEYIELEAIYETEDRILIRLYGPRDCLECNIRTCIKGENSLKDKINKFFDEYPLILERHPTLIDNKFPAPEWLVYPEIPAGSIGWRMGYGEDYLNVLFKPEFDRKEYMKLFDEPKNWDFNEKFAEYMEFRFNLYAMGWSDRGLPKYEASTGEKYNLNGEFMRRLLSEEFRIGAEFYDTLKDAYEDSKWSAKLRNVDWNKTKYTVLLNILYFKIMEDDYLIDNLVKTGNQPLSVNLEDQYWKDELLDLALMEVRDEINRLFENTDRIDWLYTEFLMNAPIEYYDFYEPTNKLMNKNTAEYMICEKTYENAEFFVRDVNLTRKQADKYAVGKIILEKAFVDSTPKIGKMTTSHRYAILSNHTADLSDFENETDWNLHTTSANSKFKILDVYEYEGKTQILLLHLIDGFESVFEDDLSIKSEWVEKAREIFENSFAKEVIESVNSEMWLQRCEFPVGLDQNDEYWPLI